jgi:ribosomal protein S18 acetylase RimI-like enzyme
MEPPFALKPVALIPATPADIAPLERIHAEACAFFAALSGAPDARPKSIADALAHGDLPPGGTIENFELLTVRTGEKLVGYAETYRGYPSTDTGYIGLLYLTERGRGLGASAAEELLARFRRANLAQARLGVLLTNPRALKFWHKMGFTQITKVTPTTLELARFVPFPTS